MAGQSRCPPAGSRRELVARGIAVWARVCASVVVWGVVGGCAVGCARAREGASWWPVAEGSPCGGSEFACAEGVPGCDGDEALAVEVGERRRGVRPFGAFVLDDGVVCVFDPEEVVCGGGDGADAGVGVASAIFGVGECERSAAVTRPVSAGAVVRCGVGCGAVLRCRRGCGGASAAGGGQEEGQGCGDTPRGGTQHGGP